MSALELICPKCEMVVDGAGDGMICVMFCSNCRSADVVNMAEVTMCVICDEMPAARNDTVCVHCWDSEQDALDLEVADLIVCEKCGHNPVTEGDNWCKCCISAKSKQRRKPKKTLKNLFGEK